MKKFYTLFVLCFFVLSFDGFSQVKVNSSGDVSIVDRFWTGGINFGRISYSGYEIPAIYPNTSNAGGLGSANNYFHIGYIHHIYSSIYDTWPSDKRAKNNVRKLENAIDRLMLLDPILYDINDEFIAKLPKEAKSQYKKHSANRLGFIAQDVQKVLPELVNAEPTTGYLGINTVDMIPLLVKAIKEQQAEIDALKL